MWPNCALLKNSEQGWGMICIFILDVHVSYSYTAAVAQWVRTLAPQAEGWVFESQPQQITGSDSSIAKRSEMSAEHRSKFAALHHYWWRLHMSEKLSSVTKNPKQTKS